jgi:hypothetical protein
MVPKVLLVNPPIYDFTAYDFWLKPYGLLSIAGYLRGKANFALFDYLDREHSFVKRQAALGSDQWGRGRFYFEQVSNPDCLSTIPRHFRRFGVPRQEFRDFLVAEGPFDFVLVQTVMTYWYPGVEEVVEDLRHFQGDAKIILGGNYATVCARHAQDLGADLVVAGKELEPLWECLSLRPDLEQPALWEAYEHIKTGVLKLSDGCPFDCTYCSVPRVYGQFEARSMVRSLDELELLVRLGAEDIAFYDDALVFNAEEVFVPFLSKTLGHDFKVNFHSPNGLNARFITKELAEQMVRAGFKTFYLGFESTSPAWQRRTGSKVYSQELAQAVDHLVGSGAEAQNITAYQLLGHPDSNTQDLEDSMRFVNGFGIRGMLADFSPIPGTVDGLASREWVDMTEPLMHNKTAFPIIRLGFDETNRLKDLQHQLNRNISAGR